MLELISKFLGGAVIAITGVFVISKLLNKNVNLLNIEAIFILVVLSSTPLILYQIHYNYNNSLIIFTLAAYGYSRIFKIPIDQSIVVTFLLVALIYIAEVIFMALNFLFFKISIDQIRNTNTIIPYLANISVCFIAVLILRIKALEQLMKDLTMLIIAQRKPIIIAFCLIEVISICLLLSKIGMNFEFKYILGVDLLLIVLFLFIFFVFIMEKVRYEKLTNEYDYLVNYVKNIEDWMEKERIRNHENKNQLYIIKNMVSKQNKKLLQYLDSIANEAVLVENDWLTKLKNIPRGGLQGLIYYKISQIQKEKINLSLDISKNLNRTHFSKINAEDNRNLCTILGVYLDNAIDAAKLSDKKQIGIEIYLSQGAIRIAISNTYCGTLDISQFYNYGYSTKGIGRGYGLALVKSIIQKNKSFSEYREIISDYYVQYLYFKKI